MVFARTQARLFISDVRNMGKPLFEMDMNPKLHISQMERSRDEIDSVQNEATVVHTAVAHETKF